MKEPIDLLAIGAAVQTAVSTPGTAASAAIEAKEAAEAAAATAETHNYGISVSSTTPKKELVEFLRTSPYSRIPVYEGHEKNVIGILPANLYLSLNATGKPVVLRKILLKPYVFDQNTEITQLLQRMRLNKLHMVFITNEKRKKIGLITMEDLLEELVGEIQDETDTGEGLDLE